MSGALLFLFVSAGIAATAVGAWFIVRHRRLGLRLAAPTQPLEVQPEMRPSQGAPEDRRLASEPTKPVVPGPSDDQTAMCASAPAPTLVAEADAPEVRGDRTSANAAKPVEACYRPDLKPAQAPKPSFPDEGGDARGSTSIEAIGEVSEPIETVDDARPASAEEAIRGVDCHTELPLVVAGELGAQAGAAPPDTQFVPPATASSGIAASSIITERNTPASSAPNGDDQLVRDSPVAEVCIAQVSNENLPTEADTFEVSALADLRTADCTAVPEADRVAVPPKEFEKASGEHAQQPLPEASAVVPPKQTGSQVAAWDVVSDETAPSGPPELAEKQDRGTVPETRPSPSKPAQHRDRRGQRRAVQPLLSAGPKPISAAVAATLRPPAEVRLRLMLRPLRRTASLSVLLARPPGYPDRITLLLEGETEVGAYSEDRYDDVDLEWTPGLLSGEVRLDCKEGYQWLRSSRRVHIFGELVDEPGLISVGSASLTSSSAIVCRRDDVEVVRSAAAACGSSELISHDSWAGVPAGWVVLSGFRPAHAASSKLDSSISALDPGIGAVIRLLGGLQVRPGSFAQGSPPRIEIEPFPAGARVTIGGAVAAIGKDGSWSAPNWDEPGDHLVDVVPGPSLTYRILGDPWQHGGWDRWDAHPERFPRSTWAPWSRAQICGASLLGPSGEHVVAAEALPTVIALGLRRGIAFLRPRPDTRVAVALLQEPPAFLVSSSGPRRTQGYIDWLAPNSPSPPSREVDLQWLAVIRTVASRRLTLRGESTAGQSAWRRARERARRHWSAGR